MRSGAVVAAGRDFLATEVPTWLRAEAAQVDGMTSQIDIIVIIIIILLLLIIIIVKRARLQTQPARRWMQGCTFSRWCGA